jgi:hypothetical protein
LLALAAVTFVALNGGGGSKRPYPKHQVAAHRAPQHGVLRGSSTSLLMWPAGAPIFGDLPGGGPGTTVDVDNLNTGKVSLKRIPNIAGGDFPYQIAPVGRRLVYNAGPGVSVIGDGLAGTPRVLGTATWFVPSVNGNVLLVHARDAYPVSVRSVSVATGVHGPIVKLPKGTSDLVYGTHRGLLLLSPHRPHGNTLELWRPDGTPSKLAYLPDGLADANARLVDYGSACRSKTAMFSTGASGYQVCPRLHVIDLLDGRRFSFPAPAGTIGWLSSQFSLDSGVAPHTILAAQAAITPARAGHARLFVLHLGGGARSPIPVPDSTAPFYARTAWSTDRSSLLYQGPGERLRAFRLRGTSRPLGMRCCEYAAVISIRGQSG